MKVSIQAILLGILFSSGSHADPGPDDSAGVILWRGFNTAMTPAMVAEEINRTGLDKKGDVVADDMPKKPYFERTAYNPIPVHTKNRLSRYSPDAPLELSGHTLGGPSFRFDGQDKLAEVRFSYTGDGSAMPTKLGCYGIRASVVQRGLEFLTSALQNKYELLQSAENFRVFSDGSTRVWLTFETKFEKSPDSQMFKCNEETGRLQLHYGDQRRIESLIEGIIEDKTQKAIDVL